ncbi:MAG: penicillin-binding protein 1A [Pseudomonadota bacterium]|nr:penicillin-binding protein 1A [Pseudomonadota bacterium]
MLGWFGQFLASVVAVPLDVLTLGLLVASAFVAATLTELPQTDVLREVRLQEPLRVFSADGSLMAEFGVQRRSPVSFDEIPPLLIKAFLATEDSRFFEHEGIDVTGLGRAAISYARTGERTQGGSTITMQVARNFFLSREKTFQRKFAELLLSLHIERTLSKEEILELYLNKIFFGHRAYGISAAAALYYDKPLDALTVAQMAMLAGVPKAPSANNPVSNPDRARSRRDYILRRMRELGYIKEPELQAALQEPDRARLHRQEVDLDAGYLSEMVRQEMVRRFGEDAYREGYRVTTTVEAWLQSTAQDALRKALLDYDRRHGYRGPEARYQAQEVSGGQLDQLLDSVRSLPGLTAGIVVRSTAKEAEVYIGDGERVSLGLKQVKWARPFKNEKWRGRAPRKVSDAVAVGDLIRLKQNGDGVWELSQAPSVAGALVALSPTDGAVRALAGGYHFAASKFNRAVDARRQPGSSFKPFVYASALDKGWTPASLIKDERISIRLNRREMWEPDNFDHKTMGPIRLRKALTLSRNLASVYLLRRVGLDDVRGYVSRFGFDLKDLPLGLSMVLGTAEVSPLQMAGAYSVFANGGFRVFPYFISRVENGAGDLVFEANPPSACSDCWFRYEDSPAQTAALERRDAPKAERVLEPRLTFQMNSLLQDVIKFGTGRRALKLEREDIAGKTGTTNDVRDSWFCGYQKDLVTVTWMGFDEFNPLGKGETGGQAGLGMWVEFMGQALKDKPEAILDIPEGMVEVRIDKNRGTRTDSTGSHTMAEWVREEYELMLLGPQPVYFSGGGGGGVRRRAPRVIDELF